MARSAKTGRTLSMPEIMQQLLLVKNHRFPPARAKKHRATRTQRPQRLRILSERKAFWLRFATGRVA